MARGRLLRSSWGADAYNDLSYDGAPPVTNSGNAKPQPHSLSSTYPVSNSARPAPPRVTLSYLSLYILLASIVTNIAFFVKFISGAGYSRGNMQLFSAVSGTAHIRSWARKSGKCGTSALATTGLALTHAWPQNTSRKAIYQPVVVALEKMR
jgi:hypothetical protein